jgi:hypothetical protein
MPQRTLALVTHGYDRDKVKASGMMLPVWEEDELAEAAYRLAAAM